MLIAWVLFGALIGLAAASRKGFSKAGGVIGGLMLGPLAVLMYLVSGDKKRCPQCAEWIEKKAKLCPHCRSEVAPAA